MSYYNIEFKLMDLDLFSWLDIDDVKMEIIELNTKLEI